MQPSIIQSRDTGLLSGVFLNGGHKAPEFGIWVCETINSAFYQPIHPAARPTHCGQSSGYFDKNPPRRPLDALMEHALLKGKIVSTYSDAYREGEISDLERNAIINEAARVQVLAFMDSSHSPI